MLSSSFLVSYFYFFQNLTKILKIIQNIYLKNSFLWIHIPLHFLYFEYILFCMKIIYFIPYKNTMLKLGFLSS